MRRLRVAFLNASHEGSSTTRNFRRDVDADLVEFDATGGQLPDGVDDFDAAVVSGSRSSVYWDEEWIQPAKEWVAEAAERMPVLGVCFGHQLVADALGGTVEDMGEYELGYRTVERTADHHLFDGVGEEFTVFISHSDRVTELPPGANLLAENDYGVHAFRKGDAFGVQFHPEYDMETAERITKGKDLPEERIQSVLDGIHEENYRAACEAKQVFDNFCRYARRRASEGDDTPVASD